VLVRCDRRLYLSHQHYAYVSKRIAQTELIARLFSGRRRDCATTIERYKAASAYSTNPGRRGRGLAVNAYVPVSEALENPAACVTPPPLMPTPPLHPSNHGEAKQVVQ